MSDTVELRPAYAWDCEQCGRENFTRAIVFEPTEDEIESIREKCDIESGDEGILMTHPDSVTCEFCGATFKTEHMPTQEF